MTRVSTVLETRRSWMLRLRLREVGRLMFNGLRDSAPQHPSPALQRALVHQGLPADTRIESLSVVAERGSYAGRPVRYFGVFDPLAAQHAGVSVRSLKDFDAHPELLVASGHVERNGDLALTERDMARARPNAIRVPANRADHLDDERWVFQDSPDSGAATPRLW